MNKELDQKIAYLETEYESARLGESRYGDAEYQRGYNAGRRDGFRAGLARALQIVRGEVSPQIHVQDLSKLA